MVRQHYSDLLDNWEQGMEAICAEPCRRNSASHKSRYVASLSRRNELCGCWIKGGGELPEGLKNNELWWSGPKWLNEPESSWPSSDVAVDCPTKECMMEARKKQVSNPVENTQVTVTATNDVVNLEEIIGARKHSDSERLFRTTAWMLRFVHNLKVRTGILTEEQVCTADLLNCEISKAEILWLKTVQKTAKSESNYRQLERDLGLFEDEDGVVRCDGRIGNAC